MSEYSEQRVSRDKWEAQEKELCLCEQQLADARAEIERLEARTAFIEHDAPDAVEPHFCAAMSLLTERRAFAKSECALLIAEQMKRADKAEQQLAKARAEIERFRNPSPKALGALVVWAELSGNKRATEKDAALIWQDVVSEALAAPAPGKDSEGKE